ncbi:2OG-Fe(II) oxygenase [Pseudomonas sp. TMP9]|uniref:2OG-Fe(II) oxygenase n=1 Tax=Pseudomonas sp. TMP9 TaxID=3133144 RepID=UPI0030D2AD43
MNSSIKTLPISLDNQLDFNTEDACAFGLSLNSTYTQAQPFPHIVIDNFLPEDLIDCIHSNFPLEQANTDMLYERGYKGQHKRQINPNQCSPQLKNIFAAFNSAGMLQFIEKLTGIDGLIPDPYFIGGGLHETKTGGFLGVHSDFRINKKLNIERRINVIIYLNKDWQEEYGGNLELWDKQMKTCLKRALPIYNRCVIFNTDKDSNHGHPEPLTSPEHITRKSIALYYYTSPNNLTEVKQRNKTHYKPRPKDRFSLKYYINKLMKNKN